MAEIAARLSRPKGPIEVIRGPRQVGKTTGIYQIVRHLLAQGVAGSEILLVRFDLELLREQPAALRAIFRWYRESVRQRPQSERRPSYVFLDEVHKLRRWSEEVKHLNETFPVRMLLTGSSSVLVARGGRESLAGRVFTTELPTFSFRETLECWRPGLATPLPPRTRFNDVFKSGLRDFQERLRSFPSPLQDVVNRELERYFARGGYPRLYSGEIEDELWADYLTETVFQNVLGADIPDLFPIRNPDLLRFLYLRVAQYTATEIAQSTLANMAHAAGIPANQVTVGQYLRYLTDALLIREFQRYPLVKKRTSRVPAKLALSDLGVRNAIFRGAPSLWDSDPGLIGPLVETLVQTVVRDHNLQVHFFRDFEDSKNRRSPVHEVDFVAESVSGTVLPIEVKFRHRIDASDLTGLMTFRKRYRPPMSIVVTREHSHWNQEERILFVPLATYLLAF